MVDSEAHGDSEDIRTIFNSADREEADRRLALAVKKYGESAPKLAGWMETNLPQGFTVFALPAQHRRRLRTTNCLEMHQSYCLHCHSSCPLTGRVLGRVRAAS